jgi:predicted DNA-binding protein YlxM (UPF0122 family)
MDAKLLTYISERKENIERYSSKITTSLESIEEIIDGLTRDMNFKYVDKCILLTDNTNGYKIEYNLCINNNGICIRENNYCKDDFEYIRIYHVSRKIQKNIIKRLPDFLNEFAKELTIFEGNYQHSAELAENIAFALKEKTVYRKYGSIFKPE